MPIGTSGDLKVGQKVFAIGNPFGLDWTLTTGIVSALDRSQPTEDGQSVIEHLIQTDAAINPGNSGGPLLDSAGRLIGINASIYSPSGASAGIGFAIPVDTVMRVVPQLIHNGHYTRPSLGIQTDEDINQRVIRALGVKGVAVLRVTRGSTGGAGRPAGAAALAARRDRGRRRDHGRQWHARGFGGAAGIAPRRLPGGRPRDAGCMAHGQEATGLRGLAGRAVARARDK